MSARRRTLGTAPGGPPPAPRPCPFCGTAPSVHRYKQGWQVQCREDVRCAATPHVTSPRSRALAVKLWNRRTPCGDALCIGCGCTDRNACLGGCAWVFLDAARGVGVCSTCVRRAVSVKELRITTQVDRAAIAALPASRILRGRGR